MIVLTLIQQSLYTPMSLQFWWLVLFAGSLLCADRDLLPLNSLQSCTAKPSCPLFFDSSAYPLQRIKPVWHTVLLKGSAVSQSIRSALWISHQSLDTGRQRAAGEGSNRRHHLGQRRPWAEPSLSNYSGIVCCHVHVYLSTPGHLCNMCRHMAVF